MPANIKSNSVDLDSIFFARDTASLSNNTNVLSGGTDLSTLYMPITDSSVINPGSQISSTGILTSTVPYPTDSQYGLVELLLPMNGTNGSTSFTDASKNNLVLNANGVTHSTSDYRFGSSCATFGNYLDQNYIDLGIVEDIEPFWYFGPQDWCVEFWVKDTRPLSSLNVDYHGVFTIGLQSGFNYSGVTLGYVRSQTGGYIFPEWWFGNVARTPGLFPSPTIAYYQYNTWNHFAFTNINGQYRVYINGINPIRDGVSQLNYINGTIANPEKDFNVRIGSAGNFAGTPGFIDDLRITIGSPRYTTNFTPPRFPCQIASYDYNNANVISSLLVNFEGVDGSTNFSDASYNSKTLTAANGAEISTDQYKFGVSSGYFSGSSYVSFPANQDFTFGTGDFTIESWVYPVGSSISNPIRIFRMNSGTFNDYTFEVGTSNDLVFFGASSGTTVSWSANVNLNQWNHVAWSRYKGVLYAFLNGQSLSVSSGSATNNVNIESTEFNSFPAGVQGFNLYPSAECYIDNLVVTKGVAKYIDSFNVPVIPSSFGPNDVSGLFATKLNMTGLAAPPNTSVSQTGWTVPSGGITWTHTVTATFSSNSDLVAFFNAGGEIYIYPSYTPRGEGVDSYLYTLLDRVTRITIGGNYTKQVYNWGTVLQPNIGGANVGTSNTQLFIYSFSTDGIGLNSTYSISLAANAAAGSSTILTITTTLSLPRVSIFTYSNTYASLIKYRYSSLALQPTFVGSLSSNVSAPIANFTSNVTSGNAALTVNFTDTSSGNPTSWAWDFTNDGSTDSTLQNPSYTYTSAGTYTVKLTATNAAGSNTVTKVGYITVASAPIANFTGSPTSGLNPLTVNFTDTSTGSPTAWAWDFTNDGSTDSTLQNPSYTYASAGTYSVKLTATNTSGSSTVTKSGYITVSAAPVPVTANFTGSPTSGLNPLTVNFTDTSTGSPTAWAWDFTNDGIIDSTVQNPSYTYSNTGTYSVTLTASKSGSTDTITKTNYITVNTPPPVGVMKLTYNTSLPGTLSNRIDLPISVESNTFNIVIDWGDGNSTTASTSSYDPFFGSHTYSTTGTYQVTITGTIDKFGAPGFPNDYLVSVDVWDDYLGLTSLNNAFSNAANLISVPSYIPTTVTSTRAMFGKCTSFNDSNITLWDMSNITDISGMFAVAILFNQPIGSWNTSNITKMINLFGTTSGNPSTTFNQNISSWDVSSVTDMSSMFNGNSNFNQPIGNWNVSNVTNFTAMFANTDSFNQDIGNWDVSSAFYNGSASYGPSTGLDLMFSNSIAFNQDLSGWCVTNITQIPYEFDENTPAWNKVGRQPIWGTCPP